MATSRASSSPGTHGMRGINTGKIETVAAELNSGVRSLSVEAHEI